MFIRNKQQAVCNECEPDFAWLASTNKCQRCSAVFLVMNFQFVYKLWIIFCGIMLFVRSSTGSVLHKAVACMSLFSVPDKTSIKKVLPKNLERGGWQTSKLWRYYFFVGLRTLIASVSKNKGSKKQAPLKFLNNFRKQFRQPNSVSNFVQKSMILLSCLVPYTQQLVTKFY